MSEWGKAWRLGVSKRSIVWLVSRLIVPDVGWLVFFCLLRACVISLSLSSIMNYVYGLSLMHRITIGLSKEKQDVIVGIVSERTGRAPNSEADDSN